MAKAVQANAIYYMDILLIMVHTFFDNCLLTFLAYLRFRCEDIELFGRLGLCLGIGLVRLL